MSRDMRQLGEDRNQFAMWQVFCWSARVMCLCISPLPIPRVPDRVRQFANLSLTGSSLSLYSNKVFTRFWGGFDIYASVLLTPSCFLFKQ